MAHQQAYSLADAFRQQGHQQQHQVSFHSSYPNNSHAANNSNQLPAQYGQAYAHRDEYLPNSAQSHYHHPSNSAQSLQSSSSAPTIQIVPSKRKSHDFLSLLAELNSLQSRYQPFAAKWSQQQQTLLSQIAVLAMSGVPFTAATSPSNIVPREPEVTTTGKSVNAEGITAAKTAQQQAPGDKSERTVKKRQQPKETTSVVKPISVSSSSSSAASLASSSHSSSTSSSSNQKTKQQNKQQSATIVPTSSSTSTPVTSQKAAQVWTHKGSHQPNYLKNPLPDLPKRAVSYILFKSYDAHDLQLSQSQSIWATLPKNQDRINHIFDHSEKVIAFFSVNGSRAFQGWAEVLCGIGRELTDTEWLKADGSGAWGEVFRVKWQSTKSVPFEKIPSTVANKWNYNKPVKIGYDGTELDPDTGAQLQKLFV